MYYKIVNTCDLEALRKEIRAGRLADLKETDKEYKEKYSLLVDALGEQISILGEFYGEERNAEQDLGGYAYCFATSQDYKLLSDAIKEFHHMKKMESEYADVIAETAAVEMILELFLPSGDFAVVMAYPREKQ